MREVDLRNLTGRVSPKYIDVPQPMLVLHSTDELRKYAPNAVVINGVGEFYQFMKEHNLLRLNTYTKVTDSNIWLATNETFIPDYMNEYDVILWKLEGNKAIPTDNCYIRLYYLVTIKRTYILFTSSGLFNVSLDSYELTAAVKPQFIRTQTRNVRSLSGHHYEENFQRLMAKKTSTVRNTRLFYLLFSRESPYFLDVEAGIKAVYGSTIKAKDRKRIIESFNFQRTFLKELEYFMPELKLAFQKNISDDKMVDMALTIFDKSTEKGTTEDMIKAYDLIYQLREDNPDNALPGNVKLVTGKNDTKILGSKPKVEEIHLFNEADILEVNQPVKNDEEDIKLKEKELEALREETGAVDYVNKKDAY